MAISLAFEPEALKSFAKFPEVVEVPDLIQVQLDSFRWFQEEGLRELFEEISPILDYTGTRLELRFADYEFREPRHSMTECLERGVTYSSSLYAMVQLVVKETGEIKQQELFFGDFPLMTNEGTFIISGAERVVVNQLTRFPGIYFTLEKDPVTGRELCLAKLVAERGAWLDFDTSSRDAISVKVSGKRKILATTLLRAIGFNSDDDLLALFQDVDNSPDHTFIRSTIERDPLVKDRASALVDVYRKLSSGEPPSLESAKALLNNFLFNPRRYSLGKVGRYKLNKKLGVEVPEDYLGLKPEDVVQIVRHIILINNGKETPDDIDHLGNRRAQTVGFLMQKQFHISLLRLERAIKERMSILGPEAATPSALINIRPVVAAIREFFGRSQLCQFMDQTNPLAELTHKRRLSAMGPGGLSRERAGFEVRDVHHSHYGRICPIETPEGPNIGLIGSLATYASVNKYGFVETPYRKVVHELPNDASELLGRMLQEDMIDDEGHVIIKSGTLITDEVAQRLARLPVRTVKVGPFVSNQIARLTADEEEQYSIAQANVPLNERSEFVEERVEVKRGSRYFKEVADKVDFMDVSPKQIFSVSASLIPFLEHDDANRALMGSNMQRQAVPLLRPHAPLVATGMEREVAKYSGQAAFALDDGVVTSVTSSQIVVQDKRGKEHKYLLSKFIRTNQGTCINQYPIVNKGDKVKKGQALVSSSSIDSGELALGQNVICAFMSWRGYNYEDAIIISERWARGDVYSSIHIEKYEIEARDTKLGPEEITRDIPNISEESLSNLDEQGIIRIGAEVSAGDILVGKITPKGETELSAEEKLLRAIFGEKTREVKDNSLKAPPGEWGRVIDTRVLSRDNHDELPAGVNETVRVWVAQKRKISAGDKMSGRHGNKGVVSIVLPEEDMPFLPDGTPVDIILNPLGVPSRMNIGQVLEAHLGWAAYVLGFRVINPIFDGADAVAIEDALARVWIAWKAGAVSLNSENSGNADWGKIKEWLGEQGFDAEQIMDERYRGKAKRASLCLWLEELGVDARNLDDKGVEQMAQKIYKERRLYPPTFGKMELRDGRTGESFDQPITVGNVYMMKLIHLVEDKVHARSTGPYSLITQQPLGGKAQFGGQRFGEMEVWALEGYGAAHILQEMLTVKSDDVVGRAKAYEAIVKGEDIQNPGIPEACKVLFMELRSLGLAVELLNEEQEKISLFADARPRLETRSVI
jgi:DNA-directed RNA polymerase subunit beta